jgi:hypothetical protein
MMTLLDVSAFFCADFEGMGSKNPMEANQDSETLLLHLSYQTQDTFEDS